MRKSMLAVIVLVVMASGCQTSRPSASFLNAVLITVDYRLEPGLQQQIVHLLKSNRARDLVVSARGSSITIKAVFLEQFTRRHQIFTVAESIQSLGGVIAVNLEDNKTLVRQTL